MAFDIALTQICNQNTFCLPKPIILLFTKFLSHLHSIYHKLALVDPTPEGEQAFLSLNNHRKLLDRIYDNGGALQVVLHS